MTVALDFETEAIEKRPHYPPTPVGLAVATTPKTHFYTRANLMECARSHWHDTPVFHSAQFDISVGMEQLKLPFPEQGFHDTIYLLALLNPYLPTLALKPSIEEILHRKPKEQADLRTWIVKNIPGAKKSNFGRYIARAPQELVEPYARQDAAGTLQLFEKLMPRLIRKGMQEPYDRERALLPMLLDSERRGIRVNLSKLRRDVVYYRNVLARIDAEIRVGLGSTDPNLDLDSNKKYADALEALGVVLPRTEKGNRRTDKKTLAEANVKPELKALVLYRSKLAADLRTFMIPWYDVARETGGKIHTHWNQTRGTSNTSRRGGGARTGRMSSEPNFQNITTPESVEVVLKQLAALWPDRSWPLPMMRDYIVPWEKGWVLYGRDFSQQELRLLANYDEEGLMSEFFNLHPNGDVHDATREMIQATTGFDLPRKLIKILNFLNVYGGGIEAFCRQSGLTKSEGAGIRAAYFKTFPTIKILMRECAASKAIRTLGGRRYEPETDKEYKLLNILIQGSAADQTKEVMRQWWSTCARNDNVFYLSVHDELVFSCPREDVAKRQTELRSLMETTFADRLSVPFLTTGEVGTNWGHMKEVS